MKVGRFSISLPNYTRNYAFAALFLLSGGILILIASAVYVRNLGFTALGVASILMGVTIGVLPQRIETSTAMKMMLEDAVVSTNTILENQFENGIQKNKPTDPAAETENVNLGRVTFLPPQDGVVSAFVAFDNTKLSPDKDLKRMINAPFGGASISSYLSDEVYGIRVYPAGATIPKVPEVQEMTSSASLQDILDFLLVELMHVCESASSAEVGDDVIVEMKGVNVSLQESGFYSKYLGSIGTSIAATAIATFRNRPVTISEEISTGDRKVARLKTWGVGIENGEK